MAGTDNHSELSRDPGIPDKPARKKYDLPNTPEPNVPEPNVPEPNTSDPNALEYSRLGISCIYCVFDIQRGVRNSAFPVEEVGFLGILRIEHCRADLESVSWHQWNRPGNLLITF